MHGREPIILWVWPKHFVGVVSCLSAIQRQFCIEKSHWEFEFCPLSGIKKHPLLGGCFGITTMLISIRNTELVHCREVVCFSEGPLSEARLYTQWWKCGMKKVLVKCPFSVEQLQVDNHNSSLII